MSLVVFALLTEKQDPISHLSQGSSSGEYWSNLPHFPDPNVK